MGGRRLDAVLGAGTRLLRAIVVLWVLSLVGCMGKPRELEYHRGVLFLGFNGNRYELMNWSRDRKNALPCPIVIHLAGIELDEKKLSDPKALAQLGWVPEDQPQGWTWMNYRRGNLVCWTGYERGVLARVGINALTCSEKAEGIVSVNGKSLSLPIGEDELIDRLGNPLARR
jgi:hypothetical protein